jgi:hypothetical protein
MKFCVLKTSFEVVRTAAVRSCIFANLRLYYTSMMYLILLYNFTVWRFFRTDSYISSLEINKKIAQIFLISPKLEMLTHCSSAHTQNLPYTTQSNLKFHFTHQNKILHYNIFRKWIKREEDKEFFFIEEILRNKSFPS